MDCVEYRSRSPLSLFPPKDARFMGGMERMKSFWTSKMEDKSLPKVVGGNGKKNPLYSLGKKIQPLCTGCALGSTTAWESGTTAY